MRKRGTQKRQDGLNRCADCGTPTANFLCDRCAEICDHLTFRGEYWFRRVRPVREPRVRKVPRRQSRTHETR